MMQRKIARKFGRVILFGLLSSMLFAQTAQLDSAHTPYGQRIGILLLAYGGDETQWDEDVRHVADQVDLSIPTEVAFGMARRSSMQAAVDRLVQRKVTEIVAVPPVHQLA